LPPFNMVSYYERLYFLVSDDIVTELVEKEIQECESQNKSWIIQGFPRTKVQALSLQKIGIIPDKFVLLKVKQTASLARIKNNLIGINQSLYGPQLEDIADQCLQEYELNMKGVREAFSQFIFEHDAMDKAQVDVGNELKKMLSLRFKSNAPRRPPRVIVLGPPGSGRDTQATLLAQQFGLVHISARQLLKKEISNNPQVGKFISGCFDKGDDVPDEIINPLIEKRLKQSDCRVNGWVLEGFPYSKAQVNLLKSMRVKPSVVFLFEATEDESVRRLGNRRVDPTTGDVYNLEVNPPSDEATSSRLIELVQDSDEVVRKAYGANREKLVMLEEAYRAIIQNVQSERTIEEMNEHLADAVTNPL
jgi:adenylate kinase